MGRKGVRMSTRREVMSRGACELAGPRCTEVATTIDHWVPRSQGGGSSKENLRPACFECNQDKGDMLPEEWWEYVDLRVECSRKPLSTTIEVPLRLQEALPMSEDKTPEQRLLESEGFVEHVNRIHEGIENGTIKTVRPDDLP